MKKKIFRGKKVCDLRVNIEMLRKQALCHMTLCLNVQKQDESRLISVVYLKFYWYNLVIASLQSPVDHKLVQTYANKKKLLVFFVVVVVFIWSPCLKQLSVCGKTN